MPTVAEFDKPAATVLGGYYEDFLGAKGGNKKKLL